MSAIIDLTGHVFGRLTVIAKSADKADNHVKWLCRCECSNVKSINGTKLRQGTTRSCGCLRREVTSQTKRTHGASGRDHRDWTPEYRAWVSMRTRCTNQGRPDWPLYGGRGITVCPEWMNNFQAFLSHIGPRPSQGYSVDRIDVNGNYEPGNVRWATASEQAFNRRPRRAA